jgi:hypothetical protein
MLEYPIKSGRKNENQKERKIAGLLLGHFLSTHSVSGGSGREKSSDL